MGSAGLFLFLVQLLYVSTVPQFNNFQRKMSYHVEKIAGPHLLGEGPHWDPGQQALFYVDALASSICRYLPSEDRTTVCKLHENATVALIIPVKGTKDQFLVTIQNQLTRVTWDGESSTPQEIKVLKTIEQQKDKKNNRFNDGKIDPTGRLWIGTMGGVSAEGVWELGKGSLYSFGEDLAPTQHVDNITIANGLAWSQDLKTMYYIDTPTKRVDAFDYDPNTGHIENRRPAFDFTGIAPEDGGPDGMTIDSDDNLWVAVFGGAGVYNIDPRNKSIIRKIDIPSYQTTSVAFGGENLDELYVVSANFSQPPEIQAKYPEAGATFRVTGLGVTGLPALPIELP